jgi:hypothetical protein
MSDRSAGISFIFEAVPHRRGGATEAQKEAMTEANKIVITLKLKHSTQR